MSDASPPPLTPALDPVVDPTRVATIDRLRETADLVRRTALEIARLSADLAYFDRLDVWQGGRATAFRDGLRQQQRSLNGATEGVVAHLEETARRIELRAGDLQVLVPSEPAPTTSGNRSDSLRDDQP